MPFVTSVGGEGAGVKPFLSPFSCSTLWCVLLESLEEGKLARRMWEWTERKGTKGISPATKQSPVALPPVPGL